MRGKKGKSKISITKYLPVLIILLSITIIVGSTFAYFTDKKDANSDLRFSKVELSSETMVGVNGELRDVIPGSKLVDGAVEFSKAIDSEAIYVRAKISFSLPAKYKDDVDMQQIVSKLRNATDFNIVSDEQAGGAVWSAKDGNYFYLVTKDDNTKLMRVDTIDTYLLSNEVVVPRDLESLENNSQYMKSINFHIAFEAIQADNVSDVLVDAKTVFTQLFPESEGEKYVPEVEEPTGIVINVHSSDLTSVIDTIVLTEAGTIEEPTIELEDGKILEGWYSDSALTTRFDFTQVVSENISLYPNVLSVSENLAYTPIYATATTNNSPDFTVRNEGEIVGYSVALGTCEDTIVVIPESYEGKPVTEITANGFENNTTITQVMLPNSLTTINQYAFSGCSALTKITIPENVTLLDKYAYKDTVALTELNFNATEMADFISSYNYVFYNSGRDGSGIKVTFGANVKQIPTYLFAPYSYTEEYYPRVKSVEFEEGSVCTRIGNTAFYYCMDLQSFEFPESLTTIEGTGAFVGCKSLNEIKFNSVNLNDLSSSGGIFYNSCQNTTEVNVVIGKDVRRIPGYFFAWCNYITSITFEEGNQLEEIGIGAFMCSAGFETLALPSTVTTFGTNPFRGCTSLTLTFEGNESYYLDGDCIIDSTTSTVIIGLGSNIPSNLNIGTSAFERMTNITSVELTGTTSIADNAFFLCGALESVVFTDDLISIGTGAFSNCNALTIINIPKNVKTIGKNAFSATNITTINFNAENMDDLTSSNYPFSAAGMNGSGITVTIGKNVTKIPAYLFEGGPKVTSVVFEDDSQCTSIGTFAFANNPNLTSIEIPENVTTIERRAFVECKALTEIKFDAKNLNDLIFDSDLFHNAGQSGNGITFRVGANVNKIPAMLFNTASSVEYAKITQIIYEEGCKLTSIGNSAFAFCIALTHIEIPSSVTTIGVSTFNNCYGVTSINYNATSAADLDSQNYTFSNVGKNGGGITLTIGANVERIPAHMFNPYTTSYAPNITIIDFADGSVCTEIAAYAFSHNKFLQKVEIPSSVTTISEAAYYNCRYITEINYNAVNVSGLTTENSVFGYAGSSVTGVTVTFGADVESIPANLFDPWGTSDRAPKILSIRFEEGSKCTAIGSGAFAYVTNYVLCTNTTIAGLAKTAGATNVYVIDTTTSLDSATFTEVASGDVNGTYNDGTNDYVRTGVEGSYKYYIKYAA